MSESETDSTIRIGSRVMPSRYFLAPLAGYTHLAFRRVIRRLGGLGLATTDLVLASQLLAGSRKSKHLTQTCEEDRPLSVQIFSGVPDDLINAAKFLQDRGFEGVDINMGCPMAKINSQGGGARLMCDADGAAGLVERVVHAVSIPVTVKMRLGWDRSSISSPLLARRFEQVGAAAVTIHGRTRSQGFHGSVDLEAIAETVSAVDSIPVVGNGDVRTVEDALRMRAVTGCHAVAIGRGAMLDPWLFMKLQFHEQGRTWQEPDAAAQIDFLRTHFGLMVEQHGDYACIMFRKFAGWYGARLGIPEPLEDRLRRIESVSEFTELAEKIQAQHGQRISPVATALVKVPNGPNELW